MERQGTDTRWHDRGMIFLMHLARRLPLAVLVRLGAFIGWLITLFPFSIARAYRVALTNILLCYPHLSHAQAARLARRSLTETGRSFAEFAHVWTHPPEKSLARISRVHGMSALREAIGSPRPVLLLTLHQSSWELPNLLLAPEGPMTVFYQPHSSSALTALVTQSRSSTGSVLATADASGVKMALGAMSRNETVAILADHTPKTPNNPYIPFFGYAVRTSSLPAKLMRRYHPMVFFVSCQRLPDANHVEVFIEPAPAEIYSEDEDQLLTVLNQQLEAIISRCPAQYLWVNKRFRRLSDGKKKTYRQPGLIALRQAREENRPLRIEDIQ